MDTKKNSNEQVEFKREIGTLGAASIMFNVIIGSGIFYLGALVLQYGGFSQGISLIAWVIGGIVSLLGALCVAELGTSIRKPGGYPVYLSTAYHPLVGYIYAFNSIFISGPISSATFGLAFFTAYKTAFGLSDLGVKIGAVVLIVVVGLINLNGVKSGTNLAKGTMVLKLVPIFLIIIIGCLFGNVKPDLSLVIGKASGGTTLGMLLLAVNATLWAYQGWNFLPAVSEEMKNPSRDIPRVLILSLSAIMLIYGSFHFAIYRVLPQEQIVSLIKGGNLYIGTSAASTIFSFGGIFVTICIMISVFGSFNSSMLTSSRVLYAITNDGHFFKSYAKLNKKGAPLGPIAGQVVLGSLFVIFSSLQGLTVLSVFIASIANLLCIIGVPVMRKKYPDIERPFKVSAYYVVLPLSILAYIMITVATVILKLSAVKVFFIVPVVAVIVYYLFEHYNKKQLTKKDSLKNNTKV